MAAVEIAILRAEENDRHDRLGHGATAAGDLTGEPPVDEFARVARIPEVPHADDQGLAHETADDRPTSRLRAEEEIRGVGDEVLARASPMNAVKTWSRIRPLCPAGDVFQPLQRDFRPSIFRMSAASASG
jgi:hypothetical protein